MLHGVACLGVDGVGIFLAVLVIEVAVIAAGGHGLVGDIEHGLYLVVRVERIVNGLGHSNFPWQPFGVDALCDDLAANFYHEIADALVAQQLCHTVASVTLGY